MCALVGYQCLVKGCFVARYRSMNAIPRWQSTTIRRASSIAVLLVPIRHQHGVDPLIPTIQPWPALRSSLTILPAGGCVDHRRRHQRQKRRPQRPRSVLPSPRHVLPATRRRWCGQRRLGTKLLTPTCHQIRLLPIKPRWIDRPRPPLAVVLVKACCLDPKRGTTLTFPTTLRRSDRDLPEPQLRLVR